jgi:hypothetical protein
MTKYISLAQTLPIKSNINLTRYFKLIDYVITNPNRKKKGHTELHHILPKSMFPSIKEDNANKILLTNRQHFLAHWLLWKIFRNKEMSYAFNMMKHESFTTTNRYWKLNSKSYSILKEESNKFKSEHCHFRHNIYSFPDELNPMFNKSFYECWVNKYGKEIADQKLIDFKLQKTKETSGSSNPMYGRVRKGEVQVYDPTKFARIRKVCCMICKKEITQNTLTSHQKGKYCLDSIQHSF